MLSSSTVILVSLAYVSLLFVIAWLGERWTLKHKVQLGPWVYGLSLAIYCSSWSFLGTVGQASTDPWAFLPVYLAPILLFSIGFGFIRKLVIVSKAQSITSVADFIAARYGKSQLLAALVTLIATLGILPYVALQIKAMVFSFSLFTAPKLAQSEGLSLLVALMLALFAALFGTRKLDATENNPGMILAIAFESLIKLSAFLLVGAVVVFGFFDGPTDVFRQAEHTDALPPMTLDLLDIGSELIIACAAFFCLPRMFHVMVVEVEHTNHVARSRWMLPLYVVLMGLFVVPLAMAGRVMLGDSVTPDTYVISLPLALQQDWLAVVALLGTISAASSMVIVAVVTIAIMISNEWLVPVLLRTGQIRGKSFDQFSIGLLNTRRVIIFLLLLASYWMFRLLDSSENLAQIGMLALGAFAQLAPALVGGLYWKKGHRNGVLAGLIVGFSGWCYPMGQLIFADALPVIPLFDGLSNMDLMLLILLANSASYYGVSRLSRPTVSERIQAGIFVQLPNMPRTHYGRVGSISQQDLLLLASRFVGPARAYSSFSQYFPAAIVRESWNRPASEALIEHTERLIASVLGASSASVVMDSVMRGRDLALDEVFSLVDEASAKILMSQDQLRGAIEHAFEGMSVIDGELNLVAWNKRYEELFTFPKGFLRTGLPVADIIRYNALLGRCGPGNIEEQVNKRVAYMRAGSAHTSERCNDDGRVIRIRGNPMPDGGFVMTFSDITDFRAQEAALKEANENLEARVAERTARLAEVNASLLEAKAAEELANQSKSRFLAAVGHDLMQPLNAARLFTASMLQGAELNEKEHQTVVHIAGSLKAAGAMLSDLLDISKLDANTTNVELRGVNLSTVLTPLAVEFAAMAQHKGLKFRHRLVDKTLNTDPNLLRRVVQNFLTNALRYTESGTVLLGCRRRGDFIEIQVWDTGCGIAEDQLDEIFKEFRQVEGQGERSGLGLGLAIADRISKAMATPLKVQSKVGRGSMFSVTVPLADYKVEARNVIPLRTAPLKGVKVLCIDNEEAILAGLESLLSRWQCQVVTAKDLADARYQLGLNGFIPDIVLADFHLDHDQSGLEALDGVRKLYGPELPGILITADTRPELIEEVERRGYRHMAKMVRPAALRAMISASIR